MLLLNEEDAFELAERCRAYLKISIEMQSNWENEKIALENWRNHIQDKGVFVFKDAFRDDLVDGFCLLHNEFPIIYLNNSRPSVRKVFTLSHELGHILIGKNGITPDITGMIKTESVELETILQSICTRISCANKRL